MLERIIRSPFTMMLYMALLILFLYITAEHEGLIIFMLWVTLSFSAAYILLVVVHNYKNPDRKVNIFTLIPYELKEEDEGQVWMTNKACRKVYVFFYFAVPIGAIIITMYPTSPEVPLVVLFVMAAVQYSIYWYEAYRYLH